MNKIYFLRLKTSRGESLITVIDILHTHRKKLNLYKSADTDSFVKSIHPLKSFIRIKFRSTS